MGLLLQVVQFQLLEPLRELFKDEVREVGKQLGLPESILERHPFPGPGLAVRIIGEITFDRLEILRMADAIYLEELKATNLYQKIWQAFAVLLPVQSVGVMGDERTYENVLALRAVTRTDGMTADWYDIPAVVLGKISNRIINVHLRGRLEAKQWAIHNAPFKFYDAVDLLRKRWKYKRLMTVEPEGGLKQAKWSDFAAAMSTLH